MNEMNELCVQVNKTIMLSIVSEPKEFNYVHVANFSRLQLVKNALVNRTCLVRSTTTPLPTNPPANEIGEFSIFTL